MFQRHVQARHVQARHVQASPGMFRTGMFRTGMFKCVCCAHTYMHVHVHSCGHWEDPRGGLAVHRMGGAME